MSVSFKSWIEKNIESYHNSENRAKSYFKFYQAWILSSIMLDKVDFDHIDRVNETFKSYYKDLYKGKEHSHYEIKLNTFTFKDRRVITEYIKQVSADVIESNIEEKHIMKYIEGAIATEHPQKYWTFMINVPPYAHAEPHYNFFKMYKQEYGFVDDHVKLYKEMKQVRFKSEEQFKETVKKAEDKKDKKVKSNYNLGQEAYKLKSDNPNTGWRYICTWLIEIDPSLKCSEHKAKKEAIKYATDQGDTDFVYKFTKIRKKKDGI